MATRKPHILIVDDDRIILDSLAELLKLEGYRVSCAESLDEALRTLDRTPCELVMTDINMPGGDGFELLTVLRKQHPETVCVMMTAYGTIESAVEAIKMGAYDYLTKPIIDDEIRLVIERALNQQTLLRENRTLKRELDRRFGLKNLVGHDPKMLEVLDLIEAVADSDVTVLIQGPSGTGKSMTARALHQLSPRRDRPFIEVAVGAIPESLIESELFGHVRGAFTGAISDKAGKFTAADGGTIFLDEIGTASPSLQIKLLRVLQEHCFEPVGSNDTQSVDVRVVLATNADLDAEVEAGRFREDLYYRLNVIAVELPALVDRLSDVPLLADHFLKLHAAQHQRELLTLTPEAGQILQEYHWPGNVRELSNVMERCAVLVKGSRVRPEDLPDKLIAAANEPITPALRTKITSLKEALAEPEKRILEAALKANNWNRQLTAKQLNINRTTLYKKMKRYGLDRQPAGIG